MAEISDFITCQFGQVGRPARDVAGDQFGRRFPRSVAHLPRAVRSEAWLLAAESGVTPPHGAAPARNGQPLRIAAAGETHEHAAARGRMADDRAAVDSAEAFIAARMLRGPEQKVPVGDFLGVFTAQHPEFTRQQAGRALALLGIGKGYKVYVGIGWRP